MGTGLLKNKQQQTKTQEQKQFLEIVSKFFWRLCLPWFADRGTVPCRPQLCFMEPRQFASNDWIFKMTFQFFFHGKWKSDTNNKTCNCFSPWQISRYSIQACWICIRNVQNSLWEGRGIAIRSQMSNQCDSPSLAERTRSSRLAFSRAPRGLMVP